jgi:hypothetical protein
MPSLKRIVTYITDNNLKWTYTGEFANEQLKLIQVIIGTPKKLTTHVGRHTFATQSLAIGMSKDSIAQAMGVGIKIVDTYAKNSPDKLRNELRRLGGGV